MTNAVNGVFEPSGEEFNGHTLYRKVEPGMWLYVGGTYKYHRWIVGPTEKKDANDSLGLAFIFSGDWRRKTVSAAPQD